jgi:hypothetical protein
VAVELAVSRPVKTLLQPGSVAKVLMLVEQFVLRIEAAKADVQLMQDVFHVGCPSAWRTVEGVLVRRVTNRRGDSAVIAVLMKCAEGGHPVAGGCPRNLPPGAVRAHAGRRSFMTSFFSLARATQSADLPWWTRFLP